MEEGSPVREFRLCQHCVWLRVLDVEAPVAMINFDLYDAEDLSFCQLVRLSMPSLTRRHAGILCKTGQGSRWLHELDGMGGGHSGKAKCMCFILAWLPLPFPDRRNASHSPCAIFTLLFRC